VNLMHAGLKRNSWTDEENERLKTMVAGGATAVRAAAAFRRTIVSVRTQARKIGSPFPPIRALRRKWQDAENSSREKSAD
jgi:GcrA cell cycle regulator